MRTKPFSKQVALNVSHRTGILNCRPKKDDNTTKIMQNESKSTSQFKRICFHFLFVVAPLKWKLKHSDFQMTTAREKKATANNWPHCLSISAISHSDASYNEFRAIFLWNSICTPLIFIANCGILCYWNCNAAVLFGVASQNSWCLSLNTLRVLAHQCLLTQLSTLDQFNQFDGVKF